MNRPRNRQSRPSRLQHSNNGLTRPGQGRHGGVPTIQQVIPGASVSIILKEDQPTGQETPGVVKDLLTKGNHPRGIKVRLRDGQVGRVQRMILSDTIAPNQSSANHIAELGDISTSPREGTSGFPSLPPQRSLADFIPNVDNDPPSDEPTHNPDTLFSSASIKCPICNHFEGDEAAVSHHIECHLT
ncbi:hypothetical protein K431DRAFT_246349 [Polychaeton citri CBS 116435]|uniref:UBZ4-type domain-containing protein n=1 Tax=Polychaeton citri CBS 116435 TaxID=1314669 RepID=A0A9P4QBE2_9PEZI|nr:hypothetical protein K431DRAFT_246349 [Polychaeton citri CBS 116435]